MEFLGDTDIISDIRYWIASQETITHTATCNVYTISPQQQQIYHHLSLSVLFVGLLYLLFSELCVHIFFYFSLGLLALSSKFLNILCHYRYQTLSSVLQTLPPKLPIYWLCTYEVISKSDYIRILHMFLFQKHSCILCKTDCFGLLPQLS